MKKVTLFETIDGRHFVSKDKALRHEAHVKAVNKLYRKILPKKFDTDIFANGRGYLQYSKEQATIFREEFADLIKEFESKELYHAFKAGHIYSFVRTLEENSSPSYSLYRLINCLTLDGTLVGQEYFVSHFREVKGPCLNSPKTS